ncbi:MAG TPA: 2-succinyl-5-enolpyruvyl-6-hydroxy-3-cyclohexene-1-carboxylic-acid synthase [Kofleriaceae bacterium]|jgi:2-succinyl-5-enolpyruvyl-6-hydroxy-3-cyclohexene-1-carboxylate synthase|nr:2-succinyl-5-enolpyruvyl-6-hydroxy-3-cyclohexene-1-carboxylic-acid synthase [Kofleriaceae bacterium]
MTAAIQTLWAELVATSLADAGIARCVISPGSRSTPLVAALAREPRLALVTLIDERAAAFFALGAARATGVPVALVCTSGTAAAHYLPAIVEASLAGVPLLAITADRPPELYDCGASQTIDQIKLYGDFVRGAIDLGAPSDGELALRAVRRKIIQAITLARGPAPGPVHLEVPLRKPLEPAAPATDAERALAAAAARLAGPVAIAPPRLAPDAAAIAALAANVAAEPDGVIIAGALPAGFAASRAAVLALAAHAGYPILAEAGSQLRFGPRPDGVVFVDHFDLVPAAALPVPRLVIQLGSEPVAAAWPGWLARLTAAGAQRWVLAGPRWHDPDSSARGVILGDPGAAVVALHAAITGAGPGAGTGTGTGAGTGAPGTGTGALPGPPGGPVGQALPPGRLAAPRLDSHGLSAWRTVEATAARATAAALDRHPDSEAALLCAVLAALPPGVTIQIGNSLPIRVIDQISGQTSTQISGQPASHVSCHAPGVTPAWPVLTQRGAAGIDGLIASAAGATCAGAPVLLVLGDVSFAHDLGGLVAARAACAPLAILVIDNRGGQIFAGLPVARASQGAAFERHWITEPDVDVVAVARALGHPRAFSVTSAYEAAVSVAQVLAPGAIPGPSILHAPVTTSGAHDVRRAALDCFGAPPQPRAPRGGSHD